MYANKTSLIILRLEYNFLYIIEIRRIFNMFNRSSIIVIRQPRKN